MGLKTPTQLARDVEGVLLLASVTAPRALIETAVAGIEHNGLQFAFALDHLRPQLRFDCLCEIDPGDEKFPIVRDDGKAEPVTQTVHDRFAAIERKLELVPAVIEHDGFARRINVPQKVVKFGDVIGA